MADLIVVVELNYAQQLEAIAKAVPVWIVNTPANYSECQRLWKSDSHSDHREKGAVTCYKTSEPEDRLESLLGIISTLETHHGEIIDGGFAFPNGFVLDVVGLPLSDNVRESLQRAAGFTKFAETTNGFRAWR